MFEPVKLKYDRYMFEPYMSEQTVTFHYERHTKGYFKKLNELTKGTEYENMSLEEVVTTAFKRAGESVNAIVNNAGQAWNHDFFWECIAPKGDGGEPSEKLLKQIKQDFDSLDKMKKTFNEKGTKLFGSGWCWLVENKIGKLEVITTPNALSPLNSTGLKPILVCDLWEHSWYLDYINEKGAYLENFWRIVNWNFVNGNFEHAKKEM